MSDVHFGLPLEEPAVNAAACQLAEQQQIFEPVCIDQMRDAHSRRLLPPQDNMAAHAEHQLRLTGELEAFIADATRDVAHSTHEASVTTSLTNNSSMPIRNLLFECKTNKS